MVSAKTIDPTTASTNTTSITATVVDIPFRLWNPMGPRRWVPSIPIYWLLVGLAEGEAQQRAQSPRLDWRRESRPFP